MTRWDWWNGAWVAFSGRHVNWSWRGYPWLWDYFNHRKNGTQCKGSTSLQVGPVCFIASSPFDTCPACAEKRDANLKRMGF